MLMILDGFGLSARIEGNAIAKAEKPALDQIFKTYPGTRLSASGLAVVCLTAKWEIQRWDT